MARLTDGLMHPRLDLGPGQLLGTVCTLGGVECPLIPRAEAQRALGLVKRDPTLAIRLATPVDELPHFTMLTPQDQAALQASALDRKRDLDVLQRLGLMPGDTRRARWLYELLFQRVATPRGICAYDTPGWEGCPLAGSGAYERVREQGPHAVVYLRPQDEKDAARRLSAERIANDPVLHVRPHHFMCMACWYAGGEGPVTQRAEDTLWELWQRIRREPDVPVVLVEGCCEACYCCDGYHPPSTRCVHGGGLIRDYKKDLDVLQKLGLQPGATMPAREFLDLLFSRIKTTTEVCGYGEGTARSDEWLVCGGGEGSGGYEKTRETGLL
jgi:hypothetical protein